MCGGGGMEVRVQHISPIDVPGEFLTKTEFEARCPNFAYWVENQKCFREKKRKSVPHAD